MAAGTALAIVRSPRRVERDKQSEILLSRQLKRIPSNSRRRTACMVQSIKNLLVVSIHFIFMRLIFATT
jgi:hypothetical protein